LMAQNDFKLSNDFDKVQRAALIKESWMYMFPADDLPSYGFNNADELNQAKAGNPIEVFNMYRDNEGNPGMEKSEEFIVPIIYNNEVRAFITVAFFEGKYQVVAAGDMNLAKDASSIIMQSDASTKLIWLKHLNYSADFIATSDASGNMLFHPLFTAKRTSVNRAASYNTLKDYFQTLPLSSSNQN
jgi:hypothetical protein